MLESFRDRPYAQRRFAAIVDYARRNNEFYRHWIVDTEHPPLLDRRTALEHNDEILNGFPATGTTSGSVGVPFRYSHSREWNRRAAADVSRFVALLGGELPCIRILHHEDRRPDPLAVPVMTPVDRQVDFILSKRDQGVLAITTVPTNAERIAEEVLHRNADMSFIRRFGLIAEMFQDYQRELVKRAFPNARIWQTYSSQEFGLIAAMCPYEPEFFHIMAHRLGFEALREDESPAGPGERGQVYITDYFNMRSPLIRYELGDLVVPGKCPCNRIQLPSIRKILGRVQSTLLTRDGTRILFIAISMELRATPGMKQYKVIQDGVEDFTVRVSATRNLDREIREAFMHHMGYVPNNLRTEYVDSIPRDPNGKYQTAICHV